MYVEELEKLCSNQELYGLDTLILTMPVPKSWKKNRSKEMVRTPFGPCKWVGVDSSGSIIFRVTTEAVRSRIEKYKSREFFRVVLDKELLTATVKKLSEKHVEQLDKERYVVANQKFTARKYAVECLAWASKSLKD